MAQKIFTVHRNCYATIDVEVAAENEEEAMKIARQRFDNIQAKEYDFTENEVSIIDCRTVRDTEELEAKVRELLREEGHVSISVDVHHTALDYYGGRVCGEYEVIDIADTIYLDNDDELMVTYDNSMDSERILEDEPLCELQAEDIIAVLEDALK